MELIVRKDVPLNDSSKKQYVYNHYLRAVRMNFWFILPGDKWRPEVFDLLYPMVLGQLISALLVDGSVCIKVSFPTAFSALLFKAQMAPDSELIDNG